MKSLAKGLYSLSDKQQFRVGWNFKHLSSGKEIGYHEKEIFSMGSLRKIYILMAALHAIQYKKISLKQYIKLKKKYQLNRSGCFQYLTAGIEITVYDALVMMIIVSDNTCTAAIVDLIGLNYIKEYIKSLGFIHTKLVSSFFPPIGKGHFKKYTDVTTPAEMSYLLEQIIRGSTDRKIAKILGCSTKLCKLSLKILSWQKFNNKLPAQLPSGTKVAHKTGTRKGVHNDVGIIYRNDNPLFILSVFTSQVPKKISHQNSGVDASCRFIGKLCRMCWDKLK